MAEESSIELSKLIPNPNNPRDISIDQLASLKDSINGFEKMMKAKPIVVDETWTILAGHQRFKALHGLGYKSIPESWVNQIKDFTASEKKEFMIRDNVSNGHWVFEDFDNEFWEDEPFEEWLGEEMPEGEEEKHLEAEEDDYVAPNVIQTDIVKGDLFEFVKGDLRHRLLCGDSTNVDDVEKLMGGETADMVFTDPPYNAAFNGRGGQFDVIKNDDLSEGEYLEFINSFLSIFELFKADENYVCCDWRMYLKVGNEIEHKQLIVWNKDIPCMGKGYRNKHEFILYNGELESTTETNVWDEVAIQSGASKDDKGVGWFQGGNKQLRIHPTQKPISIPFRAINNSSQESDIVLDLFLGSHSTMVAAHQLQRNCYGMELDEKYCQVGVDRMLTLDPDIKLFRNGEDVTTKYRGRLKEIDE